MSSQYLSPPARLPSCSALSRHAFAEFRRNSVFTGCASSEASLGSRRGRGIFAVAGLAARPKPRSPSATIARGPFRRGVWALMARLYVYLTSSQIRVGFFKPRPAR